MTTRPAGQFVADQVRRCRRRLRLLASIRYACIASTSGALAASAFALAFRMPILVAVAWMMGGLGLGLVAGVAAAALRAPSLRKTAEILDRCLHLDDRAVTALQLTGDEDPVAGLVVSDASRRLAAIVPAEVFPLEMRINRRLLVAPAAAALGVLLVLLWNGAQAVRQPSNSAVGQGGAGRSLATAPRGADAAHAEEIDAGVPADIETARASAIESSQDRSAGPTTEPRRSESAAASPSSSDAQPSRDRAMSQQSLTGNGADTMPPDADRTRSIADRPAPRLDAPQNSTALDGTRSADALAAAGGPAPTGRGGATPASTLGAGTAAGGVAGQLPQAAALDPNESFPRQLSYDARYRAAWVRAQAALAHNRVPRALRSYVKDYFEAIRPAARQ